METVSQGVRRIGPVTDFARPYGVEVKKECLYRSTAKKIGILQNCFTEYRTV
jgi:hypothetical protein